MKKNRIVSGVLLAGLLGFGFSPAGCVVVVHDSHSSSYEPYSGTDLRLVVVPNETERADATRSDEAVVGTWRGEGRFTSPPGTKFVAYGLEIRESASTGSTRRYMSSNKDELLGLPNETTGDRQPLLFTVQRDAGTLIFDGERDGRSGSGEVRFRRNDSYADAAGSLTGRSLSTMELLVLATRGITRTDLDDFRSAGQTLSVSEVVRLRDQGVTGSYLREMNVAVGRSIPIDEAVRLRNHGVKAEYVRGLRDAGISVATDDVVKLRNAGVNADYVAALRQPGAEAPSVSEIIRLRNSGVRASSLSDMRAAGYNFGVDDAIRLNNHGVSSSYAKDVREAGYQPSAEDLIRLRNHGISASYLKDVNEPGQPSIPIETVIDARNKGLSADFVKKLRQNK